MRKYVLIAGVNGAGKSTLYQTLDSLQNMKRINTDEIVRSFGDWRNISDVMKAGKIAVAEIDNAFNSLVSFNQETTLCGNSIIKNIDRAKSLGYEIELHYVGVESVDIAKKRIAYL
jgi:predicted ABC-type ATPase